ncbi:unnamed protein product [Urochloa humidicola]
MRASQSQRAQPLPLPLPPPPLSLPSPPAAPRRGRHHRSSCSSSSSSSSSVSGASTFFCPSPSPAPSPRGTTSASLVPFSWERHPGVPKNSFRGGVASPTGTPLPLPPPLHPAPRRLRRRRRRANVNIPAASSGRHANCDPFAAAFAECTRDDDGEGEDDEAAEDAAVTAAKDKLWLAAPAKPTVSSGRAARPWRTAGGGFLGFLDLYGCKSAMAVADGALLARRRPVAAGPGPASGRATTRR